MSSQEIDAYLEAVPEVHRSSLEALRLTILRYVPDATQEISYRIPAFRIEGAVVAGFASFAKHMSYLPFSGSVLEQLGDEIAEYSHTKSSLHFSADAPLGDALVEALITTRLKEIRVRGD
jgi:uncharacterized protein YdhG (YjbR/CyaY superfamily)